MSKKDRIKEKWEFLCSCSSIFGLTRFHYEKNPILMVIWILASLSCLGFGIYLVFSSIKDYLDYNVITNIKSVLKTPVIFPAITLCSSNLTLSDISSSISYFGGEYFDSSNVTLEVFGDPEFGNCIRFNGFINNSIPIKTVNGTDFGLNSLYVNIPQAQDNIVMFITQNSLNCYFNATPSYLYSGKSYNFYVTKTLEEKLSKPYNQCLNESHDYHPENCIEECVNIKVSKKYNCRLTSYYQDNKLDSCNNEYFRDEFKAVCQTQCVEECYITSYYSTCLEDKPLDDSSMRLWVIMSDLKYTYINQIPKMSIFDLIGYVGGTLGLVVGFQFLSLIEIFDFFYQVILILFS